MYKTNKKNNTIMDQAAHRVADAFLVDTCTILVFVAVQCLFFWFVASKQIYRVIETHVHVLVDVSKWLRVNNGWLLANQLDAQISRARLQTRGDIDRHDKEQFRHNIKLISWYVTPVVLILIGVITAIFFKKGSVSLTRAAKLLLVLLAFGYSTELMFFFLVVNRHRHTSDVNVLHALVTGYIDG